MLKGGFHYPPGLSWPDRAYRGACPYLLVLTWETVARSGDYGKPRPALVMQADAYAGHPSVTVLPLTSELHDMPPLRITVEPDGGTGLRSQVTVDKATTIPRAKAGARIGRLNENTMASVRRALATFLRVG